MKVFALLVGPDGVGLFALLQSLLNIGILLTSFGLQASAITVVAAAHRRDGREAASVVGGTAVALSLIGSALGAVLLMVLREPIARVMLGSVDRSGEVLLLAPALLFSVVATVNVAVLAGLHQLKAATAVNLSAASLGTAVMVVLVMTLRLNGFAPGLAAFALLQLLFSGYALVRVGAVVRSASTPIRARIRDLVGLGVPVALSQGVTNGALFLIPVLVLHTLGSTEVGLYRAAVAVSLGIGTFFLAGIHQDFLPRIASSDDPSERALLIERRMRLVVGIGLPPILALLALGPVVIEVLYSTDFRPAVAILEWQLVGDLLRMPAMVLTVAVLAMRSRLTYFGLEATSGVVLILATVLATRALGLSGPGVGYTVAAFATLFVAWFVFRRTLDLRPDRLQLIVMGTAAGTAAIVAADPGAMVKLIIFGAAAVGAGLVTWPRLLRLHREGGL